MTMTREKLLEQALRELVELKDLKESLRIDYYIGGDGQDPVYVPDDVPKVYDYEYRKPLAWSAARSALASQGGEGEKIHFPDDYECGFKHAMELLLLSPDYDTAVKAMRGDIESHAVNPGQQECPHCARVRDLAAHPQAQEGETATVPREPTNEMRRAAEDAVADALPEYRHGDDCHPNDIGKIIWSRIDTLDFAGICYRAMLAAAPASSSAWIPVGEKLPEFNKICVAWVKGWTEHSGVNWDRRGIVFMVRHDSDEFVIEGQWSLAHWQDALLRIDAMYGEITHWMPLPAAPTTETKA